MATRRQVGVRGCQYLRLPRCQNPQVAEGHQKDGQARLHPPHHLWRLLLPAVVVVTVPHPQGLLRLQSLLMQAQLWCWQQQQQRSRTTPVVVAVVVVAVLVLEQSRKANASL